MKLQLVAPRQGAVWVRKGLQVFGRQPLGFASLFAAWLFVSGLLRLLPFVGAIAGLVLLPTGSLLFMIASRRVDQGLTAMPGAIVELVGAGRTRLLALLKLGLAFAAAFLLVLWLAGVLDGGAFASFVQSMSDPKTTQEKATEQAGDPRLQLGLLLRLAFSAVLSIPFWHAPALVFWAEQNWARSLVFSSIALWRNKGAFAVYTVVSMALWMLLLAILSIGAGLFGPERFMFVAVPLVLVFMTTCAASLWFTFAGSFTSSDPVAASPDDDVDPPDSLTKGSS